MTTLSYTTPWDTTVSSARRLEKGLALPTGFEASKVNIQQFQLLITHVKLSFIPFFIPNSYQPAAAAWKRNAGRTLAEPISIGIKRLLESRDLMGLVLGPKRKL